MLEDIRRHGPLPTEKEWYPVGEFFHLPKNSKQVGEVKK
jgi:hypothetical protein